jgi:esterase/lipase superfamily enzyme
MALGLGACQINVVLMPTPEGLKTGELDGFAYTPDEERSVVMQVGYATTRLPKDDSSRDGYGNKFDDNLRLGVAGVLAGDDPDARWEDLVAVSTVQERETDIPLRLHAVEEYAVIPAGIDPQDPPGNVQEILRELDEVIEGQLDPDILIFVHGARNTFFRAVAQAAQYRHFTGRNSAVLAFVWPSTGTLLRYGTDVKIARAAAARLADLIELIATHTDARYINLLGYSLGAEVVSNALNTLRDAHRDENPEALRQRLRIGEVYYAAADMGFKESLEQLHNYADIVDRVSMTVNVNDSVLKSAQFMHRGVSRAGRPDPNELSEQESLWLMEASRSGQFDLIEIESAVSPFEEFKAHDYWYNNPWVSTDVILQMLAHEAPDRRGLVKFLTPKGYKLWFFPEDYPRRAIAAAKAWEREQLAMEGH